MSVKDMIDIQQQREHVASLQSQLRRIDNDVRSISGRAEAGGRDLTTAEAASVDRLMQRFNDLEQEIADVQAQPLPRLASPNPIYGSHTPMAAHASIGSPMFSRMFAQESRATNRDFSDFGQFAKAVITRDPRLHNTATGMGESVGADGGVYVPGTFVSGIMDASLQAEAIRPSAFVFPVTSSPIVVPLFDTTARNTGVAGLDPVLTPEGTSGSVQKATLTRLVMTLHKQSVFVPVTNELLEDSPAIFSAMLQRYMVESMSAKLDDFF
jgi:HK97 family phage major capsid protein